MKIKKVEYRYVGLDNQYMLEAYTIAKKLYMYKKWNKKTTPVAVIVDKKGIVIGIGVGGKGRHAIEGKCQRLGVKGTSYSLCKYCHLDEHAERHALRDVKNKKKLKGAVVYLYGHYKMCAKCIIELNKVGIYKCVLLKNSDILFDRHHPDTVLGTTNQFV